MELATYATRYEGVDEVGDVIFVIEMHDEATATVEIRNVVCKGSWMDVAEEIQRCLNHMFKE